jgi:threonine dehydratase
MLGLGPTQLADVIGLSVPMLRQLVTGERLRIGNPVAIARLSRLRELIDQLQSGEASRDDIPLTVAQIRASTTPARPGSSTAVAHAAAPAVTRQVPVLPEAGADTVTPSSVGYARSVVARHVPPTPAYRWPLLERATGTETWVKHENHTPTGAFKVRGGLNFVERLRVSGLRPAGLVSATRGNHGQSIAYAGARGGLPVTIVVPEGNSPDKNAAMEGFGAELVVHGTDFQAATDHAAELAAERGLLQVPSFHPWLVEGVATYAMELHDSVRDLDVVYVPVGMGSGICANLVVRDFLGLRTEVVGVTATGAPAYARSFERGEVVTTETVDTLVDGVATRTPDPLAVAMIRRGASRLVEVSDEQTLEALALLYRTTHNLPEPAGAIALAGLLADRDRVTGRKVAVVMTGGNCDFPLLRQALHES